jgi:ferritin-like protein
VSAEGLHEPVDRLTEEAIDVHRAIRSIMEELEAVDWYNQRVTATNDEALAAVLAHNRDEEKEHAVMTLEWLRRHDPVLDKHLRTYLFTEGDILAIEDEAEHGGSGGGGGGGGGSLGLGDMSGESTL